MVAIDAKTRMKALVVARLLMGDFSSWDQFRDERDFADRISNRRIARSVSSQIRRKYQDLSTETSQFISDNFNHCSYGDLAKLCDLVSIPEGIYKKLDEFESRFFPLSDNVKSKFPAYAHVSVSVFGLKFEYPEMHFINDLECAFHHMIDLRRKIENFGGAENLDQDRRDLARDLISQEKFLSRSIISASFNLVESFVNGIFFLMAFHGNFGRLESSDAFSRYAEKNESSPLRSRMDKLLRFASSEQENADTEPVRSLLDHGKIIRDAVHHTTPFGRKNVDPGVRLAALYSINGDIALIISLHAMDVVLKMIELGYEDAKTIVVGRDCSALKDIAFKELSRNHSGKGTLIDSGE